MFKNAIENIKKRMFFHKMRNYKITPEGREFLYYIIDKYLNCKTREPIEKFEEGVTAHLPVLEKEYPYMENFELKQMSATHFVIVMLSTIAPGERDIVLNLINDPIIRQVIVDSL